MLFAKNLARVALTHHGLLIEVNGHYRLAKSNVTWLHLSSKANMHQLVKRAFEEGSPVTEPEMHRMLRNCSESLVDVKNQACMAAGVTFYASELARRDEYNTGGDVTKVVVNSEETPYDRVGPRGNPPEIFTKAKKQIHLFTHGGWAGIRSVETLKAIIKGQEEDRKPWNVHEPEVAFVTAHEEATPVAFAPAFDMSCRRDEGISALLLTWAKVFEHCAGYGQWFTVPENPHDFWLTIELQSWVERNGVKIWPASDRPDTMTTKQCRRPLWELCQCLVDMGLTTEEESAICMSGTGIVPPTGDQFSLLPGDVLRYVSPQLGEFSCGTRLIGTPRRDFVQQSKDRPFNAQMG